MLCAAVLLKRWAVRRFAGSGRHATPSICSRELV